MQNILFNFILQILFWKKILLDNTLICEEITENSCKLKTAVLTQDFIFEFPTGIKEFQFKGESIEIDCQFPCRNFKIKTDIKVDFQLKLSTIKSEYLSLIFQGKVQLLKSTLTSNNKSNFKQQSEINCVTLSGYCYIMNETYIFNQNYQNKSIQQFETYLNTKNENILQEFVGKGHEQGQNAAGQILIDTEELILEESTISSSFQNINKKLVKQIKKEKQFIISGTAGFIFINTNLFQIHKSDQIDCHIEAIGQVYIDDEYIVSSSSSGFILVNTQKFQIKSVQKTQDLQIQEISFFLVTNIQFSSSSGFSYIKLNDKNLLSFNLENQQLQLNQGELKRQNQFLLNISNKIDYLYFKNLNIELFLTTDKNYMKIQELNMINSNVQHFSIQQQYFEIQEMTLNFSVYNNEVSLILINQKCELTNSSMQINQFFIDEGKLNLNNSQLGINYGNLEIKQKPDDYSKLQQKQYLIDNLSTIKQYYFLSSSNKLQQLKIENKSFIQFSFIVLELDELFIDKNSILRSDFYIQAIEKYANPICGIQGQNNGGLGFYSSKTNNQFCLDEWINVNKQKLLEQQNYKETLSTSPTYQKKQDIEMRSPLGKIGGIINLKGNKLILNGIISSSGSDAFSSEKYYLSSTAGGIIKMNFENYIINSIKGIDVSGGKGDYPMGPSGGGKIIFKISLNKEKQNNFQMQHLNLGQTSFEPENQVNEFPNPMYTFYSNNDRIFLGKSFNINECQPGYHGSFCEICPIDQFKPFWGHGQCIKCPCLIDEEQVNPLKERITPDDCVCQKISITRVYFFEIILIFGVLTTFLFYQIFQFNKMKKRQDSYRLEINDIQNIDHQVIFQGMNTIKFPMKIQSSDITFLKHHQEFAANINTIFKYNFFEKFIIYTTYFLNIVPLNQIIETFFKQRKVHLIKDFIRRYIFTTNDHQKYMVKYYSSANQNFLQLAFQNQDKNIEHYQFQIKFPYKFQIIGDGTFSNQFKIDLKNPYVVLLIQNIKRYINKEKYDFTNVIPKSLITTELQNSHQFDVFFTYLNTLLASIQIKIPIKFLSKRINKFQIFLQKLNDYFYNYGFKFIFFIEFQYNGQQVQHELFKFLSGEQMMYQFSKLFQNDYMFYPVIILEVQKFQRRKTISNFFPDMDSKSKISIQNPTTNSSNIGSNQNTPRSFREPIKKRYEFRIYNQFNFITKPIHWIQRLFINIFWRCFTFYNCQSKKLPYYQIKIIFFLAILCLRIYTTKIYPIKLVVSSFFIYPPFIEEINIIFLCIQLFINKKRLIKYIIISNFICFLKMIIVILLIVLVNFKDIFQDTNIEFFLLIQMINGLLFLTLCYLNCYHMSYFNYGITFYRIKQIK